MKNRMGRLALSLILSVCLVFTMMPSIAWAGTVDQGEKPAATEAQKETMPATDEQTEQAQMLEKKAEKPATESLGTAGTGDLTTQEEPEIVENPVKSINFTAKDSVTELIEDRDTYTEEECEWSLYNIWFDEGDELTVEWADESKGTITYEYKYVEDVDNCKFVNEDDSDDILDDEELFLNGNQLEEQWVVYDEGDDNIYEAEIKYFGKTAATKKSFKIVKNPVESISFTAKDSVTELTEGRNTYKEDECEWSLYNIWFDEGDELTVEWADESKGTITYEYKYVEDVDNCKFVNKDDSDDILDDEELFLDDNQREKQWVVYDEGDDNIYEAEIKYFGKTAATKKSFKIVKNSVESISFTAKYSATELIEGCDTRRSEQCEWPVYDIWFDEGDKLTVEWADESKGTITYEFKYVEDMDNCKFVNVDDSDDILDDEELFLDDNQLEEQWVVYDKNKKNTYNAEIKFFGETAATKKAFKIVKNSVENVSFEPANEEPIELIENLDGQIEEDEEGNEFFHYDTWFVEGDEQNKGDQLTVKWANKSTPITYEWKYVGEEDNCFFVDKDGNLLDNKYLDVEDGQWEEHWEKGEHTATIKFYGKTAATKTFDVVENPVESFSFEPANKGTIELVEEVDGQWEDEGENEFFRYDTWFDEGYGQDDGDKLIVKWKDQETAVTYEFRYVEDEDNCFFVDEDGNVLDDKYLEIEDGQWENHWTLGEYTATAKFYGKEAQTKKNFEVVKNPVDYIVSMDCSTRTVYKELEGRWETDENNKDFWFYDVWFDVGDKLTIKWINDETPATYEYKTIGESEEGPCQFVNTEDPNDTLNEDYMFLGENQWENHWSTAGTTYNAELIFYGKTPNSGTKPIKIIAQTPEICWMTDGPNNPIKECALDSVEIGEEYCLNVNQIGGTGGASKTNESAVNAWSVDNSTILKITPEDIPAEEAGEVATKVANIEAVGAGTATVTATLKNGKKLTAKITVKQIPITVTIDNKSKKYGKADPELTYDTEDIPEGVTLPIKLSRVKGENVGEYDIVGECKNVQNYDVSFEKGTFEITKIASEMKAETDSITITIPEGSESKTEVVKVTGSDNFTVESSASETASVEKTAEGVAITGIAPGKAEITVSDPGDTNHEPADIKIAVNVVKPIANATEGEDSKYAGSADANNDNAVTWADGQDIAKLVINDANKSDDEKGLIVSRIKNGNDDVSVFAPLEFNFEDSEGQTVSTTGDDLSMLVRLKINGTDMESLKNMNNLKVTYIPTDSTIGEETDAWIEEENGNIFLCFMVKHFSTYVASGEKATSIKDYTIELIDDKYSYSGKAIVPNLVVKNGGNEVNESIYLLKYYSDEECANEVVATNVIQPGTYYVKAEAKARGYEGLTDAKVSFEIVKNGQITRPLKDAVITFAVNNTYSGKAIRPAVKVKSDDVVLANGQDYSVTYKNNVNIGTATIVIAGKGPYEGTVSKNFNINPQPVKLKKVSKGKKKFTAKWSKINKKNKNFVTGFQIRYSTKSNFQSGVKMKSVKGWSKKSIKATKLGKKTTYYVQLRTYKTVGKKTYYSNWSATKKVKTK